MMAPIRSLESQFRGSRRIEGQSVEIVREESVAAAGAPGATGAIAFSDVLTEAIEGVRTAFKEAKDDTTDALLGKGTPHQAMISMAKADVTFRFVTQTRNKVVEAYREMMNLQV